MDGIDRHHVQNLNLDLFSSATIFFMFQDAPESFNFVQNILKPPITQRYSKYQIDSKTGLVSSSITSIMYQQDMPIIFQLVTIYQLVLLFYMCLTHLYFSSGTNPIWALSHMDPSQANLVASLFLVLLTTQRSTDSSLNSCYTALWSITSARLQSLRTIFPVVK